MCPCPWLWRVPTLQSMKKLLFIVNTDWFFLSHRLPIAVEAIKRGYEVHLATTVTDKLDILKSHSIKVHPVEINRSGLNPFSDVRVLFSLYRIIAVLQPQIVHLVTIKPVIFGGIAARFAKVPGVVAAISGLGFVFTDRGFKVLMTRFVVAKLYRFALGRNNLCVIFQNPDDCTMLRRATGLTFKQGVVIRGSGVALNEYSVKPLPIGTPIVLMVARLLRDKGVEEFVAAAQILKQRGVDVRFQLAGDLDPGNPSTITSNEISLWLQEGTVEVLGYRDDVADIFSQAHLVVLPSYREGLPKVLIEAAACGRAVVTTDVPGCRDAIIPDETGVLVPPRNAVALADAIERLITDPEQLLRMGHAGRELAERDFAIEKIVDQHLQIYRELEQGS